MRTNDYLDAVKKRHDIESDYRLSKMLGLTTQAVTNYRRGRSIMDNTTAAKVAELLALNPLQVIADCEIERAKAPEVAKFWARYAAGVALTLAALVGGAAPAPAEAALHNPGSAQLKYRFSNSRRRKKAPPRLARTAASAFSSMAACLTGPRRLAAP